MLKAVGEDPTGIQRRGVYSPGIEVAAMCQERCVRLGLGIGKGKGVAVAGRDAAVVPTSVRTSTASLLSVRHSVTSKCTHLPPQRHLHSVNSTTSPPQVTSTASPPQRHLHNVTSTASLPQRHLHSITSTASLPQRHLHSITSTASPPQRHFHSITSTASPPQRHFHSVTSTASLPQHHLHSITSTTSLPQRQFARHAQHAGGGSCLRGAAAALHHGLGRRDARLGGADRLCHQG